MLGAVEERVPGRIGAVLSDTAPAAALDLLTSAGLTPIRYYSDRHRELALPVPEAPLGEGLQLVPWGPELDEATRLAHNDSFRDHWGSQSRSPYSWTHARSTFAPEWTFRVVADAPAGDLDLDFETVQSVRSGAPLAVGNHWADRFEDDFAARGYTFGYTSLLGVRRGWRGQGIAPAILAAGMQAFAASGMRYAALDVDTESPSGVYGLYAELGYTKTGGTRLLTFEI